MKTEKQLQLVSFEQAKRLKELGFDWGTSELYFKDGALRGNYKLSNHNADSGYMHLCSAPTVALALKWCEQEKGIIGYSNCIYPKSWTFYIWVFDEWRINLRGILGSREKSDSALLDEILTILEKRN